MQIILVATLVAAGAAAVAVLQAGCQLLLNSKKMTTWGKATGEMAVSETSSVR